MARQEVQQALLDAISRGCPSPVAVVADKLSMGRQTVSQYLSELVKQDLVKVEERGRATKYELVTHSKKLALDLQADLAEHAKS